MHQEQKNWPNTINSHQFFFSLFLMYKTKNYKINFKFNQILPLQTFMKIKMSPENHAYMSFCNQTQYQYSPQNNTDALRK